MGPKKMKSEKTAWMTVATACIATGIQQISSGNIPTGIALFICGIILLYTREHLKLSRWGKTTLKELRKDLEEI